MRDESEGEAEREDDQDRADGSLRPGRPRRRSRASLEPTGCGASHRGTAPARAWKVDRSVAQGRPGTPQPTGRRLSAPRRSSAGAGRRRPARGRSRSAIYLGDPDRSLLRPLRLAGLGVPRGPGGHPLPGRRARPSARQLVLPGRPAGRHDATASPRGLLPVPAAARGGPGAVRGAVGPRHRRPGGLHGPRGRRRRALLVDARPAADPAAIARSRRRSSSPSGRCSGTRPSSRRPGTWPTSSRWPDAARGGPGARRGPGRRPTTRRRRCRPAAAAPAAAGPRPPPLAVDRASSSPGSCSGSRARRA